MPELPEVETIRRDLAAKILQRPIKSVNIIFAKTAKNPAAFFKGRLVGRKLLSAERRGKLLIFKISSLKKDDLYLLVHLKMTGQLIYIDKGTRLAGGHSLGKGSFLGASGGELPNRHTRLFIEFSSGAKLFFNDLRKFGYLKIVECVELDNILAKNYGPEPLTKEFSAASLEKALSRKRINLKAALLDQKLIAGLGNIYVDESLFAAHLSPLRPAGSLKKEELAKLFREINRIIKLAIKSRGTTFNNYVDSEGKKGNFSRLLKVYGRHKEACPNCGRPIEKRKLAGRGTHYCPSCQK